MFTILLLTAAVRAGKGGMKVVTNMDCEVGNSGTRWAQTNWGYGDKTGGPGGSTNEGKIWEFDCQGKAVCSDSDGDRGNYMFNCGYSFTYQNELEDSDMVVVDVRTQALTDASTNCNLPGYTLVAYWDSEGWDSVDTDGQSGDWNYLICMRRLKWEEAKKDILVLDIAATMTDTNPGDYKKLGQWDTDGNSALTWYDMGHTVDWQYLWLKTGYTEIVYGEGAGYWHNQISATGEKGSTVKFITSFTTTTTTSTTESQENSFTMGFSESMGMEYETGVEFDGLSASMKYSMNFESRQEQTSINAVSNTVSNTVSQTVGTEVTIEMPDLGGVDMVTVYVWKVYRKANVGEGSDMKTPYYVTKTKNCRSIYPNCLPGYCKNSFCVECNMAGDEDMTIDPELPISDECLAEMAEAGKSPSRTKGRAAEPGTEEVKKCSPDGKTCYTYSCPGATKTGTYIDAAGKIYPLELSCPSEEKAVGPWREETAVGRTIWHRYAEGEVASVVSPFKSKCGKGKTWSEDNKKCVPTFTENAVAGGAVKGRPKRNGYKSETEVGELLCAKGYRAKYDRERGYHRCMKNSESAVAGGAVKGRPKRNGYKSGNEVALGMKSSYWDTSRNEAALGMKSSFWEDDSEFEKSQVTRAKSVAMSFETPTQTPLAVRIFAAFGLAVTAYGAFKHYTKQ